VGPRRWKKKNFKLAEVPVVGDNPWCQRNSSEPKRNANYKEIVARKNERDNTCKSGKKSVIKGIAAVKEDKKKEVFSERSVRN